MNSDKKTRPIVSILMVVAAITASACGSSEKVGDKNTLAFKEKSQDDKRLGEIDPTKPTVTSLAVTTTTAKPTASTRPPATAAPPTTAHTAPPSAVTINITSQRYEPFNFSVRKGTTLKVVNQDSQARTFTSDRAGVFDSGMIPPGGSYTYTANTPGTYNFHDETRPFVVGQMEVTA